MALSADSLVSAHIAEAIVDRFSHRGSDRKLKPAEMKKVDTVAGLIQESGYEPVSISNAFLDHMMPISNSFTSPRNLYFAWRKFVLENLPSVQTVFPISESDEDIFRRFKTDWDELKVDVDYFKSVFTSLVRVPQVKFRPVYRMTPDFWRLLTTLRRFQSTGDLTSRYPLFTLRSFLAAQVERLAGFVDQFPIGTLVSEKAFERYESWYCNRFYPVELVRKARNRPSANNPVCNSEIRMEYENQRLEVGSRLGDFTRSGEVPLDYYTRPTIYCDAPVVRSVTESLVILPPKMRK